MREGSWAQYVDMRSVQRRVWPHWTSLRVNTCELIGPSANRVVRVVLFERLEPGEPTQLAPAFIPRHRNSYDVLSVSLKLPIPGSSVDPLEPLGGELIYRPECLLSEAMPGPVPVPPEEHVEVNIYLHTEGPSGAPMITLDQIETCVAKLDRDHPGRLMLERGEYLQDGGIVREALEVCWEEIHNRPMIYSELPAVSAPVIFPIPATPWSSFPDRTGTEVKRFAAIKNTGVSMELLRLDEGASLPSEVLGLSRFVAVLAGRIRYKDQTLDDLSVIFGGPSQKFGRIHAENRSLLWAVNWED